MIRTHEMVIATPSEIEQMILSAIATYEAGKKDTTGEPPQEEIFLSEKEVTEKYGTTHSTMWRWAKKGYLVPARLGGRIRYRKSDIEKLLNQRPC